ncbi:hypothetical protein [Amycolatopsis sp. NPDC051102]|uniref:hypothetical protein n=1 Tax=Amycolatopsis sp. NPDC051102 TaxID=3155163 RepID=UPI003415B49D
MSDDKQTDEVQFGDRRDDVIRAALDAGMPCEIETWGPDPNGPLEDDSLVIGFPNGRTDRKVVIFPEDANFLYRHKFTEWTFLQKYNAVLYRDIGQIEAILVATVAAPAPINRRLMALPGVELMDESENLIDPSSVEVDPEKVKRSSTVKLADGTRVPANTRWRLTLSNESAPYSIHFTQVSKAMVSLVGGSDAGPAGNIRVSLRIDCPQVSKHDQAKEILETYSSALFFELDVKFNIALSLARRREYVGAARRTLNAKGEQQYPQLPKRKYAREAVTLYSYGRAATNTPLLQYLAYYQAIEFFFPSFHGAELLSKVRNKIRDPRFDVEDNSSLQRIVKIAGGFNRGNTGEKDQLTATLSGSLDDTHIREMVKNVLGMEEFLGKKDQIKGVPTISFAPNSQVLAQVAERVYRLRCRIVHSKADGGASSVDVLLPYSAEADRLSYDLALIHFLCQRVIACGSRGNLW